MKKQKHVLGISGGKDSAALAVYMRQNHPELDIDYFFTDTGKELPEVYDFLNRLEGLLGKPILRLNPDRNFDFWLDKFKHFLPSPQSRWCTAQLKLKPFEDWVQQFLNEGYVVNSYVAIRADENYRDGYISKKDNLFVHLPLRKVGVDKEGVYEILEISGLGLPEYYKWRSRSGCTFCFFQQKIEWLGLLEHHPEAFEEAKNYEKNALEHGSPFTWNEGETLDELAKPERQAKIRADHLKRLERLKKRKQLNPLRTQTTSAEIDELYPTSKACLICHK